MISGASGIVFNVLLFQHLDLVLVGVASAAIGLLAAVIYMNEPSSATNRAFLIFSLVTVLWGVVNYMSYKVTDANAVLWLLRGVIFLAVYHSLAFFHLFYVYPEKQKRYPFSYAYGVIPFAVLVSFWNLTPFVFSGIARISETGNVSTTQVAPGIVIFIGTVLCFVIAGTYQLISKLVRSKGEVRAAYKIIAAGTITTFALLIAFNLILPAVFLDVEYIPFGALFLLPFSSCMAYAIHRHHLFNLKVAASATLVFVLAVGNLGIIVLSDTLYLIIAAVCGFLLTLAAGTLLIRSVLKEVEQREEIEKLSQEKSEFMSFASHEIRNPITAMRGFASLLLDGTVQGVSDQGKEVAQKILVNGDTVLSLISEFLNKSKVELGQIAYNLADIDLGKTVSSIAEGMKAHAREKGLVFEVKIDFPGLMAKADEAKLREVLGNLIDNSIKYTKAGGVIVEVEKRNGMGRVVVSDTGVGIPPETISHLFQKFSRADAHKMNLLGTGLGLYLAKTFIEGMGGKIWAESDGPNKGSRFIIELHSV